MLEAVEARGIVHENLFSQGGIGCPVVEEIQEMPGVGHVFFQPRMRPIRAPEQLVRICRQQGFVQGAGVLVIRVLVGGAVCPGDLDPDAAFGQKLPE